MSSPRSREMRVGLAGLGNGAVNAVIADPGLTNHPKIKLTAGADIRPEARAMFAERPRTPEVNSQSSSARSSSKIIAERMLRFEDGSACCHSPPFYTERLVFGLFFVSYC